MRLRSHSCSVVAAANADEEKAMVSTSSNAPETSVPSWNRRIAVTVGILFIFQLITFFIGSSLIQAYLDGETGRTTLAVGVLFEMLAGLAVVAIGLLMYQVLRVVDPKLAMGYPAMRIIEFAVSASLAIYLLSQLEEFPNRLLWVYIPTAIGGLILNYLLFISRMVPRPISILGLIGYFLLLLVVPLDLLGIIDDPSSGVGLVLVAPGGLYEFIVLPLWLIVKGFRSPVVKTA